MLGEAARLLSFPWMAEAFGIYGRAGLKAGPSRVKFKTRVPMVKFDSHAHQHRQNVECLFCFSLMQISNKNRETISDRAVTPRSYRTRMFTFLMFSSEENIVSASISTSASCASCGGADLPVLQRGVGRGPQDGFVGSGKGRQNPNEGFDCFFGGCMQAPERRMHTNIRGGLMLGGTTAGDRSPPAPKGKASRQVGRGPQDG